jgi:hypothetical protein
LAKVVGSDLQELSGNGVAYTEDNSGVLSSAAP